MCESLASAFEILRPHAKENDDCVLLLGQLLGIAIDLAVNERWQGAMIGMVPLCTELAMWGEAEVLAASGTSSLPLSTGMKWLDVHREAAGALFNLVEGCPINFDRMCAAIAEKGRGLRERCVSIADRRALLAVIGCFRCAANSDGTVVTAPSQSKSKMQALLRSEFGDAIAAKILGIELGNRQRMRELASEIIGERVTGSLGRPASFRARTILDGVRCTFWLDVNSFLLSFDCDAEDFAQVRIHVVDLVGVQTEPASVSACATLVFSELAATVKYRLGNESRDTCSAAHTCTLQFRTDRARDEFVELISSILGAVKGKTDAGGGFGRPGSAPTGARKMSIVHLGGDNTEARCGDDADNHHSVSMSDPKSKVTTAELDERCPSSRVDRGHRLAGFAERRASIATFFEGGPIGAKQVPRVRGAEPSDHQPPARTGVEKNKTKKPISNDLATPPALKSKVTESETKARHALLESEKPSARKAKGSRKRASAPNDRAVRRDAERDSEPVEKRHKHLEGKSPCEEEASTARLAGHRRSSLRPRSKSVFYKETHGDEQDGEGSSAMKAQQSKDPQPKSSTELGAATVAAAVREVEWITPEKSDNGRDRSAHSDSRSRKDRQNKASLVATVPSQAKRRAKSLPRSKSSVLDVPTLSDLVLGNGKMTPAHSSGPARSLKPVRQGPGTHSAGLCSESAKFVGRKPSYDEEKEEDAGATVTRSTARPQWEGSQVMERSSIDAVGRTAGVTTETERQCPKRLVRPSKDLDEARASRVQHCDTLSLGHDSVHKESAAVSRLKAEGPSQPPLCHSLGLSTLGAAETASPSKARSLTLPLSPNAAAASSPSRASKEKSEDVFGFLRSLGWEDKDVGISKRCERNRAAQTRPRPECGGEDDVEKRRVVAQTPRTSGFSAAARATGAHDGKGSLMLAQAREWQSVRSELVGFENDTHLEGVEQLLNAATGSRADKRPGAAAGSERLSNLLLQRVKHILAKKQSGIRKEQAAREAAMKRRAHGLLIDFEARAKQRMQKLDADHRAHLATLVADVQREDRAFRESVSAGAQWASDIAAGIRKLRASSADEDEAASVVANVTSSWQHNAASLVQDAHVACHRHLADLDAALLSTTEESCAAASVTNRLLQLSQALCRELEDMSE
ncbi:hypothetical protein FVE85_5341 [Porphyridium purpureum]|uniref:Uncharacterized protein n=1 Tax=Porphyridium purpureum TaxID=35688 RepID=A0A5J4Z2B0_PORPP|nr:hypothetical protein FVE85_5341 [Porphyridium purpureum]|eukprot:POR6403..scf295_1